MTSNAITQYVALAIAICSFGIDAYAKPKLDPVTGLCIVSQVCAGNSPFSNCADLYCRALKAGCNGDYSSGECFEIAQLYELAECGNPKARIPAQCGGGSLPRTMLPLPPGPGSTMPSGPAIADLVPVNPQPQFPYCPALGPDGRTFIVTIRNNSKVATAPPTVTRLQLSQFYNLTRPTPGIAPQSSVNVSFPIPTNAPPGDWIPTVTADSQNQVAESNESNNTMTGRCIR